MHVKSDMHESPDNTPGSELGVLSGNLRAVDRVCFRHDAGDKELSCTTNMPILRKKTASFDGNGSVCSDLYQTHMRVSL